MRQIVLLRAEQSLFLMLDIINVDLMHIHVQVDGQDIKIIQHILVDLVVDIAVIQHRDVELDIVQGERQ